MLLKRQNQKTWRQPLREHFIFTGKVGKFGMFECLRVVTNKVVSALVMQVNV